MPGVRSRHGLWMCRATVPGLPLLRAITRLVPRRFTEPMKQDYEETQRVSEARTIFPKPGEAHARYFSKKNFAALTCRCPSSPVRALDRMREMTREYLMRQPSTAATAGSVQKIIVPCAKRAAQADQPTMLDFGPDDGPPALGVAATTEWIFHGKPGMESCLRLRR